MGGGVEKEVGTCMAPIENTKTKPVWLGFFFRTCACEPPQDENELL